VVVVLPPFLRIVFVVIAPFPPPRPLFKLRVVQFFFDLSRAVCSCKCQRFVSNEEDVVVVVVVKEEIKRSFLLLLRAENTPSLSLSRNDDDTKTFRAFRESV